ncbi:hypothetical protein Dimus_031380 [Dionaea muscipula]
MASCSSLAVKRGSSTSTHSRPCSGHELCMARARPLRPLVPPRALRDEEPPHGLSSGLRGSPLPIPPLVAPHAHPPVGRRNSPVFGPSPRKGSSARARGRGARPVEHELDLSAMYAHRESELGIGLHARSRDAPSWRKRARSRARPLGVLGRGAELAFWPRVRRGGTAVGARQPARPPRGLPHHPELAMKVEDYSSSGYLLILIMEISLWSPILALKPNSTTDPRRSPT